MYSIDSSIWAYKACKATPMYKFTVNIGCYLNIVSARLDERVTSGRVNSLWVQKAVQTVVVAKMLIIVTAVVIASSFVLSSAQDQPSAQCIAAYNATFNDSTDTTCVEAYITLLFGGGSNEQRMMVCDAGQRCNTMIENIISICGDTVSWIIYLCSYICIRTMYS